MEKIITGQVGDTEDHLVNSIEAMLQTVPPFPSNPCIYRVPYFLRRANEEAYTPTIISIGPFHHGKSELEGMEVNKQRYLCDFLKRRSDVKLEDCVKTLRDLEERARSSYVESINITSNEFIEIMLLDGCFIVELFLKKMDPNSRSKNDLLFKATSTCIDIGRRDMLLIENQLPFFVLEHLFNLIVLGGLYKGYSFIQITLNFFRHWVGQGTPISLESPRGQVNHFLDLYLQFCFPTKERMQPKGNVNLLNIPSATKLHEAGVKFQKRSISTGISFLDVKFTNGVLEIPPLTIEHNTECFFRNLIAMEQCDDVNTQYLSHYACLMDYLIDTPNDVALLRKYEILDSLLGDDEDVSQLFNKLSSGVCYDEHYFYYSRLREDVNAYYNTPRHAWRAKLSRDYFNTPWAIISFFAAILLLSLAIIQTVSSVISLKH